MALGRGEYPKLSTPLGLLFIIPAWAGILYVFLGEITLVGLTILDIHLFQGPYLYIVNATM
jgi:hypothetical protein